jgi:hypothetical protein
MLLKLYFTYNITKEFTGAFKQKKCKNFVKQIAFFATNIKFNLRYSLGLVFGGQNGLHDLKRRIYNCHKL